MAQLKDTLIQGSARVTDTLYATTVQLSKLLTATSSGGTVFGTGSTGQVLRSNGTTTYWGDNITTNEVFLAWSNINSPNTDKEIDLMVNGSVSGNIKFIAGSNVTLTAATSGGKYTLTIASTNSRDPGYGQIKIGANSSSTNELTALGSDSTVTAVTYNELIKIQPGNSWIRLYPTTSSSTSGADVISIGHMLSAAADKAGTTYGDTSGQSPAYGETFNVPHIEIDKAGHVTGVGSHTVKIPAAPSTSVSNAWTAGTAEGPKISTTVNGVTGTAVAIPYASKTASGVVTTGAQSFQGRKGFGYMNRYGYSDNGTANRYVADTYLLNAAGTQVGEMWYDIGDATNITTGKFYWRQYSPQETANTITTGYHETYSLPTVTKGLTANKSYDILTSKSAITIAQGGTGATTAAGARTNLGLGSLATKNGLAWDEITQSGANNLPEGSSDLTDNSEILTSYASNNGFADSNAVGKVYRRDAVTMYNYVKNKASGTWAISISGSAATASKLTDITTSDAASSTTTWRRVWFCYNDNATGRPSYDDNFAYQTSTGTLKVTKLQFGSTATYGSTTKPIYWNAGVPAECTTYAGGTAVTLNNSSKAGSTASFYAPTAGGTANTQALVGNGTTSAPKWVNISPSISITAGTGSAAPKVNVTVLGQSGTAQSITTASTSVYGVTKLSSSTSDTSTSTAATPSAVKAAYDLANGHKYWANVESTSTAAYNKAPEMATIKLNGNTSASAASTQNVTLQYNSTTQALNFVFA